MDCRWFAAFYLLMRLGLYILFTMITNALFFIFTAVCVVVIIVVQPYTGNSGVRAACVVTLNPKKPRWYIQFTVAVHAVD